MSSIHNRITTTFTANAGQALAVMGQISGGMLGIGRSSVQGSAGIGVMDRQMRAFGTTLRYALAGTAVFAAPSMVRNLSQVQEQLGLMSAIGQTPGGLPIIGRQLEDLATSAQKGSIDAITPLSDFNNAIINFLSTVQNVPEDQISPIVTDIARAAKLSQITAEDATRAFTTMSVAFGRPVNRAGIHTTAQQFFALTKLAPGGATAGGQIIQQMGQLAQVTRLAGGNEGNLFGLLLSGLRSGIPPSQLGRGLQFLIQTVGLPGQQTAESQQALGSVGIRPGIRMPLTERLSRIFNRARDLSMQGDLSRVTNLDEATLDQFDQGGGGTANALKDLGITGPGATFLGQAFHRIHALRTALALLGQFNEGTYQQDLARAAEIQRGHVQDINDLEKQWSNFAKQAKLSEAGKALSTLGLQVARIFQPLFNLGARGITGVTGAAREHPDATQATVFGTLGILGLLGASRLARGRGSGLGGLLRFGGRALPAVATGQNLLTGDTPTGTATHPLFVIVLNQLGGGGGLGRGPRGGGGMLPGGGSSTARRTLPFLVGRGLGPAAIVATLMATPGAGSPVQHGRAAWLQHFYPSLFGVGVRRIGRNTNMDERAIAPRNAPEWVRDIVQHHSVGVANRMIRDRLNRPRISTNAGSGGMFGAAGLIGQQMQLSGILTLDIDYNQPDGSRKRKKVHVRMDNWGNGSHPQHRGQNKAKRR